VANRGPGEGSIYRRADGRWCAAVRLADGGRRVLYGRTRREAADKLHAAMEARLRGASLATAGLTTAMFLERWLTESVAPKVRPKTFDGYESLVRLHIVPAVGRIPLEKLGPQDVQALLNRKVAEGLAPKTVLYMRGVLRTALNRAVRWGLVTRNAAALADPPRYTPTEVRYLQLDEIRVLLDVIKGDRLETLFIAAIALGMRQGELLGSRWSDVDLDAARWHVRRQLQRRVGLVTYAEPKTARGRRTLDVPASLVAALRSHRARQLEERLVAGDQWLDANLVFSTRLGGPLIGTQVTKHLQHLAHTANIPALRFHDLRHTCATLLLAQQVPARVVMELLGHSQISLTMNLYSHVIPALRKEAAERMEVALSLVQ
jgi:integrase